MNTASTQQPALLNSLQPGGGHYTPDELLRYRLAFAPIAKSFRHYQRIARWAMGLGVCFVAVPLLANGISMLVRNKGLFGAQVPWYLQVVIGVLALIFFGARFLSPTLACPACGKGLERDVERYCPECGGEGLEGSWAGLGWPHCNNCGATMRRGKGRIRRYAVRACTRCGLVLDDDGL